ncbi:MAG: hypothetical protein KZQ66_10435 [Candidatus Thiodiazotropha sp. (ex Lucinoma aequizonata)]|nr:hypothetical protein [Candidatus Thiodiazotropha sp. (ex Lucinoma aequizonata)]MCU7902352.1 hypothetical protein [Candidatus Thiodiazotropha sp. (ex Lucinoma aequizonata)]
MDTEALRFNSQAKYRVGGHFKEKQAIRLTDQQIMVDDKGSHFEAKYPDIFADYQNPPLTGDVAMGNKAWHIWKSTPFDWWQCQLNWALWCATAGCGVSFEDHLSAKDPLLASLYWFHVYYTTRRLLEELRVALPGDKSHSWYENTYDARAFKRLCSEFGVSPDSDWRQKVDHGNQGLGAWSTFMEPSGRYRQDHYAQGPFFNPKDAMRHNRDISTAWTTFILDKSDGFTQAGVERLNDSIRTYVWAILGAQAQTRSNILKAGTGFDAQKQFLADVEDAIASPVDIPSSIARYQKTLQYASTPLDFVFGIGLYLSPSDMALHPGNVQGFNNLIQIAQSDAHIGHNPGINEPEPPVAQAPEHEQKIAAPAGTVHRGPQAAAKVSQPGESLAPLPPQSSAQAKAHEEEKAALVVACVAAGLAALWAFAR